MKKIVKWAFLFALLLASTGCGGTKEIIKEVPVYIHDTTTAVSNQRDSVIVERQTIVREADSALLLQLGLQLEDNERAIVILQRELERKTSELSDTVTRYVEVPVEVKTTETAYVEKKLTWWQRLQMNGFWVLFVAFLGCASWLVLKHTGKK